MKIKYIVTEKVFHNGRLTRTGFGIAAVTEEDGFTEVLDSVDDLSPNGDAVCELVSLCNSLELSPLHLRDVADDFLC